LVSACLESAATALVGMLAIVSVSVDVSIDAEGSALLDEPFGLRLRALVLDGGRVRNSGIELKGHIGVL
jgi:hypothetical protein